MVTQSMLRKCKRKQEDRPQFKHVSNSDQISNFTPYVRTNFWVSIYYKLSTIDKPTIHVVLVLIYVDKGIRKKNLFF